MEHLFFSIYKDMKLYSTVNKTIRKEVKSEMNLNEVKKQKHAYNINDRLGGTHAGNGSRFTNQTPVSPPSPPPH